MKFLYHDILNSVFHFIVHCMIGALHVIMLSIYNKFVAHLSNFRPQIHIMIYFIVIKRIVTL